MTIFFTFIAILQSFSVSLGVGCSTLAVLNFFAAIRDGIIDNTERRMMGIVYIVLRVAMVAILLTTLILIGKEYMQGGLSSLTSLSYAQLIILAVLYINAVLMTIRVMPSTFGPAFQAGSWYTLGTLFALKSLGITTFSLIQFLMSYVTAIILFIAIINGVMSIIKSKQEEEKS